MWYWPAIGVTMMVLVGSAWCWSVPAGIRFGDILFQLGLLSIAALVWGLNHWWLTQV